MGGPGRGRNRARRCLGHGEVASRCDGDNDRRGPVAGKTPDTMLVDDDLARPAQTVAGVDHGLGERVGFVLVKRQRCRRGKESGKMHIRSEEHTSELQSLMRISYAVFCLKNKTQKRKLTSDT